MLSDKAQRMLGQDDLEGILPTISTTKPCWKVNVVVFQSMYGCNLRNAVYRYNLKGSVLVLFGFPPASM